MIVQDKLIKHIDFKMLLCGLDPTITPCHLEVPTSKHVYLALEKHVQNQGRTNTHSDYPLKYVCQSMSMCLPTRRS